MEAADLPAMMTAILVSLGGGLTAIDIVQLSHTNAIQI